VSGRKKGRKGCLVGKWLVKRALKKNEWDQDAGKKVRLEIGSKASYHYWGSKHERNTSSKKPC